MKIISDTTLDLRFRQHAAGLIRDLFISDEIDVSGWSKTYPEPDLDILEHLLSYSLSEGVLFWLKPIDIAIIKPFTSTNDSTFTGNLSFNYKSLYHSGQETTEITSGRLVIDICLMKETRSFGNEQFRVWEVYLGNINEDSEN